MGLGHDVRVKGWELSFQVSGWDIRFIYFKVNFLAVG